MAAEALTPEAVAAEALTPEAVAALKMAAPQSAMTFEPDFRETLGRGRLEVVANRYRCQQRRVAEDIIDNAYDAMIVTFVSPDHANGRSISAPALHTSQRRDSSMNLSHSLDLALAPRLRRGGLRQDRRDGEGYDRQNPDSTHCTPPL